MTKSFSMVFYNLQAAQNKLLAYCKSKTPSLLQLAAIYLAIIAAQLIVSCLVMFTINRLDGKWSIFTTYTEYRVISMYTLPLILACAAAISAYMRNWLLVAVFVVTAPTMYFGSTFFSMLSQQNPHPELDLNDPPYWN